MHEPLEHEPNPELHLARVANDLCDRTGPWSRSWRDRGLRCGRWSQVLDVEHVECLKPKLNVAPTSGRDELEEREVDVVYGGRSKAVALEIAEGTRRHLERRRIEPQRRTLMRGNRIPDQIRALVIRNRPQTARDVRDIAADADVEWLARSGLEDGIERPVAENPRGRPSVQPSLPGPD